ncbi:MAG: 30S ribosome-binding factor RbfA [Candidatus Omnitrophica bacterium]|nr:30S ribosome-binding factor RbfA [Candidatus Omnitrophota bacterium]
MRTIGEVVRWEMPLSQSGLVTITDVELAGDLRSATVFVSILGTEIQQKNGLKYLRKKTRRFRAMVGRTVVLKYTPQLRFELDDSVARGNRVMEIIADLEQSFGAEDEAAS